MRIHVENRYIRNEYSPSFLNSPLAFVSTPDTHNSASSVNTAIIKSTKNAAGSARDHENNNNNNNNTSHDASCSTIEPRLGGLDHERDFEPALPLLTSGASIAAPQNTAGEMSIGGVGVSGGGRGGSKVTMINL